MKKYAVSAKVSGGKYLGKFEANSKEEAEELAMQEAFVFLCHQCSSECEDPQITEVIAEEIENEN